MKICVLSNLLFKRLAKAHYQSFTRSFLFAFIRFLAAFLFKAGYNI
jgi:hypothetical protein